MKPRYFIPIGWVREGDCIRCTSHHLDSDGYPRFQRNKISGTIARAILKRRIGEQICNLVSRHTCDNRWCINPDHIIAGSNADNTRDMVERGRSVGHKGTKNPTAKLSDSDIVEIRKSTAFQRIVAQEFGVSRSLISLIRNRKLWTHL